MHSAPHRNNSDFQLRHFIAGSCHTPDAAWNLLYEQRLDILNKRELTKARILRRKAKWLDLEGQHASIQTEQDKLYYQANLIEYNSGENILELALAGAEKELETIESLMDELEPYRKYAHLPLLEATEAAQREEWAEEFKLRIENYMVSQGTVPHDQLEAMRKHPDFESKILPHFKSVINQIEHNKSPADSVDVLTYSNQLLLIQQKDSDERK